MIFPTMAAACEHYARLGFTHGHTWADGTVTLLHSAKPMRVQLAHATDGRVRSLRVLGRRLQPKQNGKHTAGILPDADRTRWRPFGQLVAVPFVAAFAAYGLLLALGLIGWGRLPRGGRRS
jgi:hypothetical protein